MDQYVEYIETCFNKYIKGVINESKLSVCLEEYGKAIIGQPVNVVVKDLDYPDIFNNVNVVYKNGKLLIDNAGIYIDTSIINKFTAKELTAAFLYELGLYELLKKHKTLKYWVVTGISSPMLAQLFGLAYALINYLEKNQKVSDDRLQKLTKTFILSLIVGIAITIISHIKSVDSTGQAGKYVIKYGYTKHLKSFLQKHERPLSLYLYGAEKLVKWNDFVKDLAVRLKAIVDKISYMEGEESKGVYCNILRYEINLMHRYGVDNYDYAKQIINEFKKTCKLTGLKVLTNPIKHFKMYYAFHELEEEIEKRYAK